MKKVAYWAHKHPQAAQLLIVAGHIIRGLLGLEIGWQLYVMGVQLPAWLCFPLTGIMACIFLYYPEPTDERRGWAHVRYRHRFDMVFMAAGMGLLVLLSNQLTQAARHEKKSLEYYTNRAPSSGVQMASMALPQPAQQHEGGAKKWLQRKIVQRMIAKGAWQQSHYTDKEKEHQFWTVLGLILLSALFQVLIGLLACNIYCTISELAGILVMAGGWALLVFLCSQALKGLFQHSKWWKRVIGSFFIVGGGAAIIWLVTLLL